MIVFPSMVTSKHGISSKGSSGGGGVGGGLHHLWRADNGYRLTAVAESEGVGLRHTIVILISKTKRVGNQRGERNTNRYRRQSR